MRGDSPLRPEAALVPPFPAIGTAETRQIRLTRVGYAKQIRGRASPAPGLGLEQVVDDRNDVDRILAAWRAHGCSALTGRGGAPRRVAAPRRAGAERRPGVGLAAGQPERHGRRAGGTSEQEALHHGGTYDRPRIASGAWTWAWRAGWRS